MFLSFRLTVFRASKKAQKQSSFSNCPALYCSSCSKCIALYSNLNAAHAVFDRFQNRWTHYSGAVDVWKRNFAHVEQQFDYGNPIRKILYTTNAVESVHSSFRKVTKKGAFSNENSLLKLLYLRTKELHTKWAGGRIQNWATLLNQLMINEAYSHELKSMRFTFPDNVRFIQLCVQSKII